MSFSAGVKRELCRAAVNRKCCAQAEAYGVLLFSNRFSGSLVRIVTESEAFARRLPTLFWKAFGVEFDKRPEPETAGKRIFGIDTPEKLAAIGHAVGYDGGQAVALDLNFAVLEDDCCRLSFCRGAFLAGGAVTEPIRGYHLELATSHYKVSRQLPALLHELGFASRETVRKSNYINYFKQSEMIEDFLTSVGAPLAAMEVMNAKAERNLRGGVNRRVNCETANVDKTVEAAMSQAAAIGRLAATKGLDSLPAQLQEAARLRVANPAHTIRELAELCEVPVTKSCFNHRLRRLMELAGGE